MSAPARFPWSGYKADSHAAGARRDSASISETPPEATP
jgi:hypothetical protein